MRTNSKDPTNNATASPGSAREPAGLDEEHCWRAWVARDRRFEGRFYMGVRTTGIYCRPGCPARLPARRNVRFYPSAAAAERAGLRPCRRCRPETTPGSAAAAGTSAIVARALRLIEAGALDGHSVEALAARVGVTSRWLRQLFLARLGAGPLAVAQTRRTHLARRLLESSTLPTEEIAAATGFGSARRMRHALRRAFGRPASELRSARTRADARGLMRGTGRSQAGAPRGARASSPARRLRAAIPPRPQAGLTLILRARGALRARDTFAFLAPRAIPGVEVVAGDAWRRIASTPAGAVAIEVTRAPGAALRLSVRPPLPGSVSALISRVARVFDLGADAARIATALRRDAWLARRIPAAGIRIPAAWDPFEMGVRAIVGQQISVAAARTILGRLTIRCGTLVAEPEPGLTHEFPTADALAKSDLSSVGLTRARAETLGGFARAVATGSLDLDASPGLDDTVAGLTALPGIGDWTAQEIALRGLGEPDAFPAGDLILRRALARGGATPTEREVRARAERWRPWRGYAAVALWAFEAEQMRTEAPQPKRKGKRP